MAQNTHVYVGPTSDLNYETKLSGSTCAPGSTQYMHGVVNFANSGTPYATIAAKQWEPGDVITSGISYDYGPGSLYLSYPGQEGLFVSPDPNKIYWLAPEYNSLWHLSWYFAYFGALHQIDIPYEFPNGDVTVSRWVGYVPADSPLNALSVVWQDSKSLTFEVSSTSEMLPKVTMSNIRWEPNPIYSGGVSYLKADLHSNIPSNFTPYMFMGKMVEEVNQSQELSFRSTRHPANAVWWKWGGGGHHCLEYPHAGPPGGCNGEETWMNFYGAGYHGRYPLEGESGEFMNCLCCFNMPYGI